MTNELTECTHTLYVLRCPQDGACILCTFVLQVVYINEKICQIIKIAAGISQQ